MTDPTAIDLAGFEEKYLAVGDFHRLKAVQDLIAAVEALRERVAELEGLKLYVQHSDNMNDMVSLGLARDAAEAHATELAGALNSITSMEGEDGITDYIFAGRALKLAHTALAALPAQALERHKVLENCAVVLRCYTKNEIGEIITDALLSQNQDERDFLLLQLRQLCFVCLH